MKRWLVFGIAALALLALLVPAAFAQGVTPPAPDSQCLMQEQGARGGAMGRGAMMGMAGLPDGALKLLGLSAEELQAQHRAGKSLAEIATAQGIESADLVDAILADRVDALAEFVKAGKLTQAQADLMTDRMKAKVVQMVERDKVGPMWKDGNRGGMGGGQGMHGDRGGMHGGQGMRGDRGGMHGGQGMRGRQFDGERAPAQQSGGLRYQSF